MTTKDVVRQLLERLPDDASLERIQYEIYVLQRLQTAEADVTAGRLVPHEEVMRDLSRWVE